MDEYEITIRICGTRQYAEQALGKLAQVVDEEALEFAMLAKITPATIRGGKL